MTHWDMQHLRWKECFVVKEIIIIERRTRGKREYMICRMLIWFLLVVIETEDNWAWVGKGLRFLFFDKL